MEKTADVVIVGGGIIGVSIAYHLARKKAGKIVLLEKGMLGEGSTGRCAGGIRTQYSTDINIRFALESIKVFEHFEEEFGINPQFRQIGYCFLATTEKEFLLFRQNVEFQRKYGIEVHLLEPEEVRACWPFLRIDDIRGAAFGPRDGHAGPSEALQGMAQQARRLGARAIQGTEVTGLKLEHGRIAAVITPAGIIHTRTVVNAAGPYAALVGAMAGVDIPVKPCRRQLFFTSPFHKIPPSFPMFIDFHSGNYYRREGEGVLVTGPKDETPSFHTHTDFEGMEKAAEHAIWRIPSLAEADIAGGWAGLYEISPDHHAILGKTPEVEGFILANGFSGHGFQHSPAVGRVIAELIVDGAATTIDISPLSIERFRTGKLIYEPLTAFQE
jgi:sarcosine oxidase subunit beta